ncbi:hypothetical protein NVV93_05595 [Pseudomonas sp. LS44]|uniref:COG3650 family protein n=1 Tax=Pseudomonas sp. LS44 TaxID=1357074 RepID=UPI00215B1EAB|nr:hypothetical protein [Pseudomonas sp. LS44]UVE18865.1 hypothetical protein NVV93_05595 [Pseudomonas sp. LS44]
MRAPRSLVFALFPLLASCQVFKPQSESATSIPIRLQGELTVSGGKLVLRPCNEKRQLLISNDGSTSLARDAAELLADGPGPLFADVRGRPAASQPSEGDGQLSLTQVYRLQREGHGCADPDFKRLTLHANGHEPDWSINVSAKGLLLQRPGQESLALPYVEEQLPEGRFNLTSEANGQRLELWVAPQRCVDTMSGAVQHLAAELRLNGKVQRGCAYYGGLRSE